MSAIHHQIPLVFETRNVFAFETLVAGNNELAVGIARQCALGQGEQQLLLWGDHGYGKTHLLQACCQLAGSQQRTVCYLPVTEILGADVQALTDLEQLDLICLDDVDTMLGRPHWELALFDLINRCRERDARLIMSSSQAPEQWYIGLRDLASRLQWGPVFQLKALSDEQKIIALQLRANQRGMQLPDNVAQYLLSHFPREQFTLFEHLDQLDHASLSLHRKLTIPFVRQTLLDVE